MDNTYNHYEHLLYADNISSHHDLFMDAIQHEKVKIDLKALQKLASRAIDTDGKHR